MKFCAKDGKAMSTEVRHFYRDQTSEMWLIAEAPESGGMYGITYW